MYGTIEFNDYSKIEYLKIFVIHKSDGSIDTEKTLYVLSKCVPEFCENWDKNMPLSMDSIYQYLYENNYEQAMIRIPDGNQYTEITFQRDLNEIKLNRSKRDNSNYSEIETSQSCSGDKVLEKR
ncbi:MAG: hypothetical protein PHR06_02200 [Candidatus Cloacimonetes bacterium]|nr:hypothetical protein [Candidatus Cloacimonadota bacterium]